MPPIMLTNIGIIVTKNVKDPALIVGNPGKRIGWACQCGEPLKAGLKCRACSQNYKMGENGLELVQA